MCGDSTQPADIEQLMDGAKADLLLTDPPYNVNYDAHEKALLKARPNKRVAQGQLTGIENDVMTDSGFCEFLTDAFAAVTDALKPGAAFYIWHADSEGYNFRTAVKAVGWTVRQCLVWVKNHMALGMQDYQWKHEPCLYGWIDGASHYFCDSRAELTVIDDKIDLKKLNKADMLKLLQDIFSDKVSTTVLYEDKPLCSELHPTMKPIKLMARLIRNSSKAGDIVLDIFGGSGSTLIACEQLGRDCYMMELDPKYCDVIIDRWEQFTGGKAERINDD